MGDAGAVLFSALGIASNIGAPPVGLAGSVLGAVPTGLLSKASNNLFLFLTLYSYSLY